MKVGSKRIYSILSCCQPDWYIYENGTVACTCYSTCVISIVHHSQVHFLVFNILEGLLDSIIMGTFKDLLINQSGVRSGLSVYQKTKRGLSL